MNPSEPAQPGDQPVESIALGPFTCNICGRKNRGGHNPIGRETATCAGCGSSIRLRSVILALSRALFDSDLALLDFPVLRSIHGLGISDSPVYSGCLGRCFTYGNTWFHREPKLDLLHPDEREFGRFDFVICSEVLEHVAQPVEIAFETLARLLAPGGVLILTVPYTLAPDSVEHFPESGPSAVAEIGGKAVLLTAGGEGNYQVFDKLSFHGGRGSTLEMRVYSEAALRDRIAAAGLTTLRIEIRPNPGFGVVYAGPCSLPMIASRAGFQFPPNAIRELAEQISDSRGVLRRVRESRWMSLGRKLGLGPLIEASPYVRGDPR